MVDLEEKSLIEAKTSKSTQISLQIAGASLFGALSIAFSALLTSVIPRIPGWGIAIIDPVSIIWIICFLIFGAKAGLLCCLIGMMGLMPFDPFAPIGPLMKFSATVALIIVPILFLKLYKEDKMIKNSQKVKKLRNYVLYGVLGVILRIGIMMIFNIILFLTLFSGGINYVNLAFIGLSGITGWTAIIFGVIIINAETSLWDLLIPYLVVYGTKIDQKFEIW
jgi:riboflavin transporter FmnP